MKTPLSIKENIELIRKLKNGILRIDKELRAGTDKKNNLRLRKLYVKYLKSQGEDVNVFKIID